MSNEGNHRPIIIVIHFELLLYYVEHVYSLVCNMDLYSYSAYY